MRTTARGSDNLYGLGAIAVGPYRQHTYSVAFDIADGDGAGGGQGDGADAGGGTPITLSEDSLFIPPGGKEPVKYGDFIKGYRPASEFTAHEERFKQGQQFLTTIASQFDKLLADARGGGRRPQGQSGQGQPGGGGTAQKSLTDLMKGLRGQAVVEGEQLAEFMEQFSGTTLEPLMKTVTALVLKNQELEKSLKTIGGSVGKLDSQHTDASHAKRLDGVLTTLSLDAKHEGLRDLADFVYRAHLQNDEFEKEYPAIFKNLVDGLRKYFREEVRLEAEKARNPKPFRMPTKGGAANPSKPPDYQHQSGRQIGARLFRGVEAGT